MDTIFGMPIYKPEHWRKRAEEARILAGQVWDLAAKDKLLQVANWYERLAEDAEQQYSGLKGS